MRIRDSHAWLLEDFVNFSWGSIVLKGGSHSFQERLIFDVINCELMITIILYSWTLAICNSIQVDDFLAMNWVYRIEISSTLLGGKGPPLG